jgi:predicted ester cyclase
MDGALRNAAVVRRFYDELWNRWELGVADEILAPDVRFRGSLGTNVAGTEAFKDYVEQVRRAFPDWHNRVDEWLVDGDKLSRA